MGNLPSTTQLLDHVKLELNITSDYALAQHVGVSKSSTANWKSGFAAPDDGVCLRLAHLAKLDPRYVLAVVQANRQKYGPAAHVWQQIFELVRADTLAQGGRVL